MRSTAKVPNFPHFTKPSHLRSAPTTHQQHQLLGASSGWFYEANNLQKGPLWAFEGQQHKHHFFQRSPSFPTFLKPGGVGLVVGGVVRGGTQLFLFVPSDSWGSSVRSGVGQSKLVFFFVLVVLLWKGLKSYAPVLQDWRFQLGRSFIPSVFLCYMFFFPFCGGFFFGFARCHDA